MKQQTHKFIALLRGINVGGHNRIPMAELRSVCAKNGWDDVKSYIQSGNLVFTAPLTSTAVEIQLERSIEQHFGLSIPVIVRAAKDWHSIVRKNPFPGASGKEPNLVMLGLAKHAMAPGSQEGLLRYATFRERVSLVGDHVWVHFPGGSGRSKITPVVLDRIVGSVVTCRNWRTVQKLEALT